MCRFDQNPTLSKNGWLLVHAERIKAHVFEQDEQGFKMQPLHQRPVVDFYSEILLEYPVPY